MANPSKNKGDRAEREVEALLRLLLKIPTIRRALGAGRQDDVGDIFGVPNTVIQVADYTNVLEAIRQKVPESEEQRIRARVPFAASFIRRRGGKWIVVQSPEQFAQMWRYANKGRAVLLEEKRARMPSHGHSRKRGTN